MNLMTQVLEACLDTTYDNPAWITDALGIVLASNSKASDFNLNEINLNSPQIKINNKTYRYSCQELNHGTQCILHELKDQDEIYLQLQKSIDELEEVINKKRSSNTVKI